MRRKIRKRYVFLSLFLLCCVIASLVFILLSAREYTCELTISFEPSNYPVNVSYETDSDHVIIDDIRLTDTSVIFTARPVSVGECGIDFMIDLKEESEPQYHYHRYVAGPFHTIFSVIPVFDFAGSAYIILVILLMLLVVMAVMIFSFIDYLKRKDFSYPMVACGGITLFSLFCIGINILSIVFFIYDGISLIDYFRIIPFGSYIYQLSSMSIQFAYFTAPFMVVFSVALTISNLALIRREGFRFVNILGILFGILWLAGFVVNLLIDDSLSGDADRAAVLSSVSNGISTIIAYFECMLFSTILCAFLASRHKPPFDRDYIVILGCAIRKDGTLTPLLKGRVDAALRFSKEQMEKTGKPIKFVPSGGQGADEVLSEGEAMKRYLIQQGVDEHAILPETQSTDTFENVRFSKEVIENDTKEEYNAAFATTNYHIFRGYILSKKNNLKNAQGISAKTKWYFFPNAFLRELVGLVVDEAIIHIVIIAILVISFVLMNISTFL